MCLWVGSFALLMCETKSRMPPAAKNSSRWSPSRSSASTIRSPLVRNAVSRRRWTSHSLSHSVSSKTSASGLKPIVVPVSLVGPTAFIFVVGSPRANSWRQVLPSRCTSATSHSESAFTTEMPTPCRPPETL